jgi:hypothetical protein
MPAYRTATLLLLLAVFFAGVAHVAALPPFEGFDESAHWSSIQQIADEGRIPEYGKDHLSADVARYPGPRAAGHGQPYQDWFATPHEGATVAESGPTHFAQGVDRNWQAQHPPLYYALLAPVYRLAAGFDWLPHMLALRLASWGFAFAGFAWGAWRTQGVLRDRGITDLRLLLPPAWPFLFPQFFPEMARLTNDTLCLLLMAAVWALALRSIERGFSTRRVVALGAVLGAGLLTKAFFLPVIAGVTLLFGLTAWQRRERSGADQTGGDQTGGDQTGGDQRNGGQTAYRILAQLLCTLVLAGAIGGAWYVNKWITTGTLTGGDDFVRLRQTGSLWHGLKEHFSFVQYGLGLTRIGLSFCWAGTWSFAHPTPVVVAPMLAMPLSAIAFYLRGARRGDLTAMAPLCLVAPMAGGLLYHQFLTVAGTGEGSGTPGWYLHIFAGPLSLALALGWRWPRVQGGMAIYALAYSAAMVPWQLSFFSGCLARTGIGTASVAGARCGVDFGHLRAITLPGVALAAGAVAAALLMAVAVLIIRGHQRSKRHHSDASPPPSGPVGAGMAGRP